MLILATFTLIIIARKKFGENNKYLGINFAQVLYIRYLIIFQKKSKLALLNLKSEVNAIHLTFIKELSFSI